MRNVRRLGLLPTTLLVALLTTQPSFARRTIVDGGTSMTLTGYCSPNSAFTADCAPYALPFALKLGSHTYSSFWVNSNGTVSLESIESFLGPQNNDPPPLPLFTMNGYGSIPVFSPNFADGQGFLPLDTSIGYDGNFVARTTVTASGFTVDWFRCSDPLACGLETIDLVTNATFDQTEYDAFGLPFLIALNSHLPDPSTATEEENFESGRQFLLSIYPDEFSIFTMTLTGLPDGFQVDYTYNPSATEEVSKYGYHLPDGGGFENTRPNEPRTFVFRSGVPEPSTWASMLLGFGLAGFALRRRRSQLATAG